MSLDLDRAYDVLSAWSAGGEQLQSSVGVLVFRFRALLF